MHKALFFIAFSLSQLWFKQNLITFGVMPDNLSAYTIPIEKRAKTLKYIHHN